MNRFILYLLLLILFSINIFNCTSFDDSHNYDVEKFMYNDKITHNELKASFYPHWLIVKIDPIHFTQGNTLKSLLKKIDTIVTSNFKVDELFVDFETYSLSKETIKYYLNPRKINIVDADYSTNGIMIIRLSDQDEVTSSQIIKLEHWLGNNSFADFYWPVTNTYLEKSNHEDINASKIDSFFNVNDSLYICTCTGFAHS